MSRMYCVRDRKAGLYWNPVVERDNVQAIRSFEMACQNPEHQFSKWPGDFELLYMGEFDQEKGTVALLHPPVVLADPMQFLSKPVKAAH